MHKGLEAEESFLGITISVRGLFQLVCLMLQVTEDPAHTMEGSYYLAYREVQKKSSNRVD